MYAGILADTSDLTLLARLSAPITIASNSPTYVGDSLSLRRYVRRSFAQRWEITTNIEPLKEKGGLVSSMFSMKDSGISFKILVPQPYDSINYNNLSNYTVTAPAGVTQVNLSSNAGFIKAGSFVRFGSHFKLYQVTRDKELGSNVINLFPALIKPVNNDTLYTSFVWGKFFMDTDSVKGAVYTDGVLMDNGSVKFVEEI